MRLPMVAIVGRPNVGKSAMFNMLAGRRISIVEPTAGVTRDRIATTVGVRDRFFELVDTGGMGILDVDDLTDEVERQIRIAIDEATLVVFVVDIRNGVVPLDEIVAQRLRSVGKPVIFVANKADDMKHDAGTSELYRLGYGEPICTSANSKRGVEELLFAIYEKLPEDTPTEAPGNAELKLAIVGRRNVGKSTFINSLAEEDRVIVSEVAGTTRDSIDVRFERDGKVLLAIDTAGVRKKRSLASDIEYYSMHRAERSIRRADVVLHFFDPRWKISRVDKQLAEYILVHHKPAIFVVNKWDLARDKIATEKWTQYLRKVFSMLDYVPIAYITAKNGKNVTRLLNLATQLYKQAGRRAKTGELNRVIQEAMLASNPAVRGNRIPKVYYVTQVGTHPPTIVIVTNEPDLFDETYIRYMTKTIRDNFQYTEVPLKVIFRTKGEASSYAARRRMKAEELGLDLDFPEVLDAVEELKRTPVELPEELGDEPMPFDEPDDAEEFDPAELDGDDDNSGPATPMLPTKKKTDKPAFVYEPEKQKKKKPPSATWNV